MTIQQPLTEDTNNTLRAGINLMVFITAIPVIGIALWGTSNMIMQIAGLAA